MIRRLFILFLSALYYLFRQCVDALRRPGGHGPAGDVVHVTYHAVKPEQKAKFAAQMDELKKLGVPVFADCSSDGADGRQRIAVTFDDGFRSFLDNALPVLTEKNIPSTIFVPAGYPGRRAGWIVSPGHPNFSEEVLSFRELGELPPAMVRIGSHTMTHPRLTALDEGRLMDELVNSRTVLEQAAKRPVNLLSFPYGVHDKNIEAFSEKAGYCRVFSNIPVARSGRDGFLAGRINVTPDDWMLEYRLKLRGAYQWLSLAIFLKRKMTFSTDRVARRR